MAYYTLDKNNPSKIFVGDSPDKGQWLEITQRADGSFYDHIQIAAGAVPANTRYELFDVVAGKTPYWNNLMSAGKIDQSAILECNYVGVTLLPTNAAATVAPLDSLQFFSNCFIEIELNNQPWIRGPVVERPPGFGPSGTALAAGTAFVDNGSPNTLAARMFSEAQFIGGKSHTLSGRLVFPICAWDGVGTMPTFAGTFKVRVGLYGPIIRAVGY